MLRNVNENACEHINQSNVSKKKKASSPLENDSTFKKPREGTLTDSQTEDESYLDSPACSQLPPQEPMETQTFQPINATCKSPEKSSAVLTQAPTVQIDDNIIKASTCQSESRDPLRNAVSETNR